MLRQGLWQGLRQGLWQRLQGLRQGLRQGLWQRLRQGGRQGLWQVLDPPVHQRFLVLAPPRQQALHVRARTGRLHGGNPGAHRAASAATCVLDGRGDQAFKGWGSRAWGALRPFQGLRGVGRRVACQHPPWLQRDRRGRRHRRRHQRRDRRWQLGHPDRQPARRCSARRCPVRQRARRWQHQRARRWLKGSRAMTRSDALGRYASCKKKKKFFLYFL